MIDRVRTHVTVLLAAWICAAGGLLVSCRQGEQDRSTDRNRAPVQSILGAAPDFVLATIDGKPFSLAEHRGEVVVVNFWATWCAPCLEEIPEFIRLQNDLGARGLQFVGISVDDEGQEVVASFAKRLDINYPIALDDGSVANSYKGNLVIPSTFIIDRSGQIRSRFVGVVSFDRLRPELESLLASDGGA